METQFSMKERTRIISGELSGEQLDHLLYSQAIGRLACTDGYQPYIVPVTYAYDGYYIYGQTNEGTKLDIMRKNPNVCLEVDKMTSMRDWQSLVVYGTFEELKSSEAEQAREIMLDRVFPLLTNCIIHAFQHEVTAGIDDTTRIKNVMYRIRIKEISGRYQKQ